MSLIMSSAPVIVSAIVFGEDSIEVTYLERRNQTRMVSKMETLSINMAPYGRQLAELQEAACDIVDQALIDLRDADDRFDKSRLRERMIENREAEISRGYVEGEDQEGDNNE